VPSVTVIADPFWTTVPLNTTELHPGMSPGDWAIRDQRLNADWLDTLIAGRRM
jgi:hypothetical protein